MPLDKTEKVKALQKILTEKTRRIEELSASELQTIAKNAGKENFIAIVHPFFSEYYPDEHYTKNTNYSNLLKTTKPNTTIILFDSKQGFLATAQRLRRLNNPEGPKIILVEAVSETQPDPKIGWQKVIKRLELAGVKKIVVGGRTLVESNLTNLQKNLRQRQWYKNHDSIEKRTTMGKRTAIRFLLQQKRFSENLHGCAGHTAAKLGSSGKFKVRTTKKFS